MDDFDALLCMTRNANRAMPRHGGSVGVLEPGRFADLLVVDGKPDQDVHVLGQRDLLVHVIKGGEIVAPEVGRPRVRHGFERTRQYTTQPYHRPPTGGADR
jgi:imidazolonepropionase-like amidohydrolase